MAQMMNTVEYYSNGSDININGCASIAFWFYFEDTDSSVPSIFRLLGESDIHIRLYHSTHKFLVQTEHGNILPEKILKKGVWNYIAINVINDVITFSVNKEIIYQSGHTSYNYVNANLFLNAFEPLFEDIGFENLRIFNYPVTNNFLWKIRNSLYSHGAYIYKRFLHNKEDFGKFKSSIYSRRGSGDYFQLEPIKNRGKI